ncbi:MAG: ATP-binding cassette domain-containing protein [Muribaculaceae bacterium]|nr:ATP-binding cassette domain-containing protein [Muribaculaceae bacterium]MDE5844403.1 ATP-binding cassette domain-containing protein [Muribaculaceae bacterium]MDE5857368.1 ATP-binding cassette domain-containing protein [Muribaculaceae bacterium]MDE7154927.1 ATP-binding cassette domain-containing protein [Muribaculaceae bacterium]
MSIITYNDVEILRNEVVVLRHVNLEIQSGEFVYLIGKVGSGKSSLMKSMYAEVPVTGGSADVLGYNLNEIKRKEIPYLRRKIGIVFQDFQLLTDRSVFDNLKFVLEATGWKNREEMEQRIDEVLKEVGMVTKAYKMPHELSGGEQQRIVIARALLNKPELILADEPTGNLDPATSEQIVESLHGISKRGTTVVMATHNLQIVQRYPGRVITCEDKQVIEQLAGQEPDIEQSL